MTDGNTLFIVCVPCEHSQQDDFGFKLATRGMIGRYSVFGPALSTKNLNAWLGKHQWCAGKGNPDHFTLAQQVPMNSDQPTYTAIDSFVNGVSQ